MRAFIVAMVITFAIMLLVDGMIDDHTAMTLGSAAAIFLGLSALALMQRDNE